MPIHVAPVLRNLELAEEAAGLIVTLNSQGYINQVNAENAGLAPKFVPLDREWKLNGTDKKGSE